MKAVILAIPVLTMAFLLGCTEQSPITGPTTTAPNAPVAKIHGNIENAKFEEMVVGPGGTKYFVTGSVDYLLTNDGTVHSFSTSLNATINQSGNDNFWVVSSDNNFKSDVSKADVYVVSENIDFEFAKEMPAYRLTLEYTVDSDEITVTGVKVVNASTADGV